PADPRPLACCRSRRPASGRLRGGSATPSGPTAAPGAASAPIPSSRRIPRRERRLPPPRGASVAAAAAVLALLGAGCAAQPDPDVFTVMNSSTDEPYHTWDQEAMDRCGKRLGVDIRQTSVPADQLVPKALR